MKNTPISRSGQFPQMADRTMPTALDASVPDNHKTFGSTAEPRLSMDWLIPGARWTRFLPNGSPIKLHVVSPADENMLRAFCNGLSDHVLNHRFNQSGVSHANLWRMLDNARGVTLLASRDKTPVALSEFYDTTGYGSAVRKCEMAVLVHQDHQRCGIASLLSNEVIRIAKAKGYQAVEWLTLVANHAVVHMSKQRGAALSVFKQDRAYRKTTMPIWFSGLGHGVNGRISAMLADEDRARMMEADPMIARLGPEAAGAPVPSLQSANRQGRKSHL